MMEVKRMIYGQVSHNGAHPPYICNLCVDDYMELLASQGILSKRALKSFEKRKRWEVP
jgi:hypothetical protein